MKSQQKAQQHLYDILGVSRNANLDQIKRAFRSQALKFHPDKNKAQNARQIFSNISYAYEILSDNEKRKQYDQSDQTENNIIIEDYLDSYGQRLSDTYKNLIKEWIKYYDQNKSKLSHRLTSLKDQLDKQWSQLQKKYIDMNVKSTQNKQQSQQKIDQDLLKKQNLINNQNLYQYIYKSIYSNSYIDYIKLFNKCTQDNLPTLQKLFKDLSFRYQFSNGLNIPLISCLNLLKSLIYKIKGQMGGCIKQLQNILLQNQNNMDIKLTINQIIASILFRKDLIQKIKLKQLKIELQRPKIIIYEKRFKFNKILKLIQKFDKQLCDKDQLEAAFIYIDLCRALNNLIGIIQCMIMACLLFHHYIKKCNLQNQKYAYWKLIIQISKQIFTLSLSNVTLSTQLYFYRVIYTIIIQSTSQIQKINLDSSQNTIKISILDQKNQQYFYSYIEMISKMLIVSPLSANKIYSCFDSIIVDLILREFTQSFLKRMQISNDYLLPRHLTSYYLFQGSWKGWNEDVIFSKQREKCMQQLLSVKGWSMEQVSEIIDWPFIKRNDGWMSTQKSPLIISDQSFFRFDGFSVNLQTGEVQLFLAKPHDQSPHQRLFNHKDVHEIFSRGVQNSLFTLDQPDYELLSHPMQQMKYYPSSLKYTNYLGTLLHTDYLLKMMTTGVQINANYPFQERFSKDGFLKRLPKQMTDNLILQTCNVLNQAHRFWIEAGEVPYVINHQQQNPHVITIMFGYLNMSVKTHLLKKNPNGQLVDDDDLQQKDQQTPQQKFANYFTQNYDQIGQYFPQLLRLRQLAKIGAARRFLVNIYKNFQTNNNEAKHKQKYSTLLTKFRNSFQFPLNTQHKRNQLYQKTLDLNNIYDYQVSWSQKSRIKNLIYQQLIKNQQNLISHIIRQLNGLNNSYFDQYTIRNWLNTGSTNIRDILATNQYNLNLNKIKSLKATFLNLGIDPDRKIQNITLQSSDECVWVPAAFNSSGRNNRKVYGGVSLFTQLKQYTINNLDTIALNLLPLLIPGGGALGTVVKFTPTILKTVAKTLGKNFARNLLGKAIRSVRNIFSNKSNSSNFSNIQPNSTNISNKINGNNSNLPPPPNKPPKKQRPYYMQSLTKDGKRRYQMWGNKNGELKKFKEGYISTDPKSNTYLYQRYYSQNNRVHHRTIHNKKTGKKQLFVTKKDQNGNPIKPSKRFGQTQQ